MIYCYYYCEGLVNAMQIRESAKAVFCSAAAVLLLLIGYYTGVLFQVSIFLAVCPAAILFVSCKPKTAVISGAAVIVLTGLFTMNPIIMAYCFLFVMLPGFFTGLLLRRNCDALKLFSMLTVFHLLSFYTQLLVIAAASGQEVSAFLQQTFDGSVDMVIDAYRQALGAAFTEVESMIVPMLEQMKQILFTYLPAISIIFCGVFALVCLILCGSFLKKMGYRVNTPVFCRLKYNKITGIVYFICLLAILFLTRDGSAKVVFSNAYMILTFAFTIEGLSLLKYFINKMNTGNTLKNLLFAVVVIVLFPLYQILSFAGLLDCFLDFGKRGVM